MGRHPVMLVALFVVALILLSGNVNGYPSFRRGHPIRVVPRDAPVTQPTLPPSIATPDTTNYTVDPATHPYIPPGPNDQRGPCPGLNTFANHGYLPRNGVATYNQLVNIQTEVGSFSPELSAVVTALEFPVSGNMQTGKASIGGRVASGQFDGPGMDAHKGIEHDASQSRNDANTGDNHTFNLTLWEQMVEYANANPQSWSLDWIAEYRYLRWQQSYSTNPNFNYAPMQFILGVIIDSVGLWTFRGKGQNATTDTMAAFFVHERLFDGFAKQDTGFTLAQGLLNAFYVYHKHPVPLLAQNTLQVPYVGALPTPQPLPFPTRADCMMCYFRQLFINYMNELAAADAPAAALLQSKVLDMDYLRCDIVDC